MSVAPEPTIVVDGVSKWFSGVVAVSHVSLVVEPGVTALLGPNGAGKTTLLRAIGGLTQPSQGTVTVFGERVRRNPGLYRRIGYMPEHEGVYDFLTGRQFVELGARLQGVEDVAGAARRAIEVVDLVDHQDRRLGDYSRGMRQRMRLAATLVHDPPLLVLDEPLSGTDPAQRLHLRDVIRALASEGRTILVSSHILEEVDQLADRIHLMVSGKLAASGDYRAIRQKLDDRPFLVRVDCADPRALAAGLVRVEAVESVEITGTKGLRVRSRDVSSLQRSLPVVARDRGVRLTRVEPLDDSLESVFEYLASGERQVTAIFALTVRQLAGSRRLWLVLGLVALPVVAAVVFRVGDSTTTSARFADNVTRTLVGSAILPLVMLLFATSAFGNELVDRTLGYLALKPIARWRIVLPKLAAAFVVGGLPVAASGFLAVALVDGGALRGALATGIGLLVGAAAYAALFTWAGLATRHALLIGLVYVFVWEATLAAYLDGIRFLSIRRYTLAVIHGLDGARLATLENPLSARAAIVGTATVVVGFTALAVRRLTRMDVP